MMQFHSLLLSFSLSLYACHGMSTTITSLTSKPQSGPCCSKATKPTMSATRPSCKTDIGLPDSMCSTNCTVSYVKLRPFNAFIQLTHLIFFLVGFPPQGQLPRGLQAGGVAAHLAPPHGPLRRLSPSGHHVPRRHEPDVIQMASQRPALRARLCPNTLLPQEV